MHDFVSHTKLHRRSIVRKLNITETWHNKVHNIAYMDWYDKDEINS